MSLTVAEKEHWKDRISRRIEKKVETLLAAEPNLMDRIHRDAQVLKAMLTHVRGVPVDDLEDTCYGYRRDEEVKSAVAKRQKVHEDELLGECDTGREILRLRQEQEDLLDTVWLASSPSQLKTLWSKVNTLLGSTPTQLERDALEIPPVDGA